MNMSDYCIRTLFTNEAQFTRDEINNSQIFSSRSQHRVSLNVWKGVMDRGLINLFV